MPLFFQSTRRRALATKDEEGDNTTVALGLCRATPLQSQQQADDPVDEADAATQLKDEESDDDGHGTEGEVDEEKRHLGAKRASDTQRHCLEFDERSGARESVGSEWDGQSSPAEARGSA
ncbi:uncharacterized protein THITE_116584 [Thermothielavioides terrestris NRRL 8126]|uniref:Uncharacterized protein n=1 Tax=Thermothielavioides terrestris (strain ATCC 38088 / NRRL 8126) TaxID=578455 RepID=G2RHF1_THETT|nr:uncharacterized protein THITE_116584 [Thermothielavioides terrestris NRRL 8126]AEO71263.1 hypothetical protein THITE_116584 [Thermothielavioides terrestris NRRL 8126]